VGLRNQRRSIFPLSPHSINLVVYEAAIRGPGGLGTKTRGTESSKMSTRGNELDRSRTRMCTPRCGSPLVFNTPFNKPVSMHPHDAGSKPPLVSHRSVWGTSLPLMAARLVAAHIRISRPVARPLWHGKTTHLLNPPLSPPVQLLSLSELPNHTHLPFPSLTHSPSVHRLFPTMSSSPYTAPTAPSPNDGSEGPDVFLVGKSCASILLHQQEGY
jgi:hypothetical protein